MKLWISKTRNGFTLSFLILIISLVPQFVCGTNNTFKRLPDQETLFQKGIELYNLQQYDNAIPIFKEIIKNDRVYAYRSQLAVYSSMWLGNAFFNIGRIDEVHKSYLTALYYDSKPIDPDEFVVIDSISLQGLYYKNNKMYAQSLNEYKVRQKLLEDKIGKNHLWANGGRYLLIDLFKRNYEHLTSEYGYDINRILAYVDTIAQLGLENYNCIKENFKHREHIRDKELYYCELMELLENLCDFPFINNQYNINFVILTDIEHLVSTYPIILSDFNDHWFRWAKFHYAMRQNTEGLGAPAPKYHIDSIAFCKIAERSYKNFLANPKVTSNAHAKYVALNGLLKTYNALSLYTETSTDEYENWSVNDFKYDFYQMEESTDSLTKSEYEKINRQGIDNLLFDVLTNSYLTIDCHYEDLSFYQKKQVNVWEEIIELLKEFDFEELLSLCSLETPYHNNFLLKTDLTFTTTLLSECNYHNDIVAITYYKLQLLHKIVKLYRDLALPIYNPLYYTAKHTSSYEEMKDYLNEYFEVADKYLSEYHKNIGYIKENLGVLYANPTNRNYFDFIYNHAIIIYDLASSLDNLFLYQKALKLFNEVTANIFYNSTFHNVDNYVSKCRLKLGHEGVFDQLNHQQCTQFSSLLKTFKYATVEHRTNMWSNFLHTLDTNISLAIFKQEDSHAAALVYNSLLFKKNILLATDKNFLDALNQSEKTDSVFIKTRNEFNQALACYSDISEITYLEKKLQPYLRDLDYNANLICEWEEIKHNLNPDECSIEFGTINCLGKEILFAAILGAKNKAPVLVKIGEFSTSQPLDKDIIDEILSALIPYIEDYSTIYFSPDGFIYTVPIESMTNDGRYWCRLTSTRNLISQEHSVINNSSLNNIVLFGGINYNTNEDVSEKTSTTSNNTREVPNHLRDGVNYLPFTLLEVNSIDSIAKTQGFNSYVYADSHGSELLFRNIIKHDKPKLLHIATHGFYWTKEELRKNNILFPPSPKDQYDEALTRSGILLSGANNTLKGLTVDSSNDGILTAKEIALFSLRDLDLVVLSACQTGLGEITGDGVFGLQRGFKKAGANSLLMSLWKVDDRATQMLMTKFYEHFLSGKSKLESLTLAQKYVREYEEEIEESDDSNMTASQRRKSQRMGDDVNTETITKVKVKPFADPKYWAAFILLDALD